MEFISVSRIALIEQRNHGRTLAGRHWTKTPNVSVKLSSRIRIRNGADEPVADEQNPDVPKRSPGFLGLGPRTPPIKEEGAFSTSLEHPQAQRSYSQSAGQGGAGVARKKSLMQKIKTMVRQRSQSIEGGGSGGAGGESGPSRPGGGGSGSTLVVSGPMAGQYGLTSPGLSEGVLEEEEDERDTERYHDAQEDEGMFGMSPEKERGRTQKPAGQM